MNVQLHRNARTTPAVRQELRESTGSERTLARQYNLNRGTVRKWKRRKCVEDRSHRAHRLRSTLTPAQEAVVVELRKTLLLPLDDLLVVTREFINPSVSRSGLDRCLRRPGVSQLRTLLPHEEAARAAPKTFKDYEPGFVHVDVKCLPQMPDEPRRRYLFVAIDGATRWVYLDVRHDKSVCSATGFLKRLLQKAPFKITRVLTDNGKEFTDRFTASGERQPTGQHPFDQVCVRHGVEHRLIKPGHLQTNGMVERFNGRIQDILTITHFDSSQSLETTLTRYLHVYNHHIPQRALGHISPIQAMKHRQKHKPELFVKRVYNHTGLDTPLFVSITRDK